MTSAVGHVGWRGAGAERREKFLPGQWQKRGLRGGAPGVLVSPASSLCRREAIVVSTMSSQKGNVARSRPQRHQNTFSFKNDKFDKSVQTKVGTCLLHPMGL